MIYINDTNRKIMVQAHGVKSIGDYSVVLINGITQTKYLFNNISDDGTTAYYLFNLNRGIVETMPNGEYKYSLVRNGSEFANGVLVKMMSDNDDVVYDSPVDDYVYEIIERPEYDNAWLFDSGNILAFDNNDVIILN